MISEKIVEYLNYWYMYRDKEDVPDMDIPVELCLEILMAGTYFGLDGKRVLGRRMHLRYLIFAGRPNVSSNGLGGKLSFSLGFFDGHKQARRSGNEILGSCLAAAGRTGQSSDSHM